MGFLRLTVVRMVYIVMAMCFTLQARDLSGMLLMICAYHLNDTVHTQRYRDAVPMMNGVDVVVGHSLGGAVALSLSQHYPARPITYAAPVFDLNPFDSSGRDRYRHIGDPVAFLDLAANTSAPTSLNPHSFD